MTKEQRKEKTRIRMERIKRFGIAMGYKISIFRYTHCDNSRPCVQIALEGTADSDGEPYSWAWYTDTYEPVVFD